MDVSEFVAAALLLELTPGPNMAYLAALSLARGRVPGFVATAGVAVGLAVHAILAALGAGVLIQQFPLIYEALRWIGVAYLQFPRMGRLANPSGNLAWPCLTSAAQQVRYSNEVFFQTSSIPNRSYSSYPSSCRFVALELGALAIPIQMAVLGSLYVGIATMVHATIVMMAAQLKPWLIDGQRRDIAR